MSDNHTVEKYIESYPFLQYINDNTGQYKHAREAGYKDPNDLFMIGEKRLAFLLDIRRGDKFVNTNLLTEMASLYHIMVRNILYIKKIVFLIVNYVKEKSIDVNTDLMLRVLCVMV